MTQSYIVSFCFGVRVAWNGRNAPLKVDARIFLHAIRYGSTELIT